MRLLYITNARIPTEKAHGLQIMKTLEALMERGIDVSLVVPKRKNYIEINPFVFYGLRVRFPVNKLVNWLSPLETFSEILYFPALRFFFFVHAIVYAARTQAEVIYTRDLMLAVFLSVLTSRSVVYEDHEPKKSKRKIYLFFLRHIQKKVIVADHLAELYSIAGVKKESFRFIPNGVDIEEIIQIEKTATIRGELGITSNLPLVIYIGSLYRWKGIYTLLDSAQFLIGKAEIIFIGGGVNDPFVSELKKRKLENVTWKNFMPHHEVVRFMRSADVLVLPNTALEERSERYTTPIKLFEYMASGTPIVASDITSFSPYLTDRVTASLFKADDPSDLARSIIFVLEQSEIAEVMSKNAQRDATAYSWRTRADKIIDFISS